MNAQTTLEFKAQDYRDDGIKRAVDHADEKVPEWSSMAYGFLLGYIAKKREFMTEDVRGAAEGRIPTPPSNRAWGGVVVRAAKAGLIYRAGYRNTRNIKAHCTPATLWRVK